MELVIDHLKAIVRREESWQDSLKDEIASLSKKISDKRDEFDKSELMVEQTKAAIAKLEA
jgi:peptidoglycan hydrolase CwlO-like protein